MRQLHIAAIAGPLAWMAGLALDWTFAWPNCVTGKVWWLVALNIVTMSVAGGMSVLAWRYRTEQPFRATLVMSLDAGFALLIFAQTLPLLLYRGCA